MESYFKLAGQFTTQSEPAFCGLGTLCMVLNALEVDPQRQWKGPWRWFDDSMLDCCRALEEIKQTGITIAEFGCLARCNGLTAKVLRADKVTKDKFHQDIIRTSQTPDEILCVSFHRGTLQQTGMGHFSPVGGYCAEEQMVLILDVARFKYPSYWVSVDLLWEALLPQDPDTGKPRGYTILKKSALSVASSCLSQLRVDKNTFPTLFEKLFQQLPNDILRAVPQNTLTSIDDFVKVLIDHIPEDFHTIVEERKIQEKDSQMAIAPPSQGLPPLSEGLCLSIPGTSSSPPSTFVPPSRKLERRLSLDTFAEHYQAQMVELLQLIEDTKLYRIISKLRQTGLINLKSSSRYYQSHSVPSTPLGQKSDSDVDLTTFKPTHHRRAPPESDIPAPPSPILLRQMTSFDQAFLVLLLFALDIPTVLRTCRHDEGNKCEYKKHETTLPDKLSNQVVALWNLEKLPLLVKNEIKALREQIEALKRCCCDEDGRLMLYGSCNTSMDSGLNGSFQNLTVNGV